MRWQRLLRSAAALIGAAVVGCESAPFASPAVAQAPPTEVRLQKPDPNPTPPVTPTPPPARNAQIIVSVAAIVNNKPILTSEVYSICQPQIAALRIPPSDPAYKSEVKKIKEAALELLIERKILVTEAEEKLILSHKQNLLAEIKQEADDQVAQRLKKLRDQFPTDQELNELLRRMGTSMEDLKRNQRDTLLAQEYLRGNASTPHPIEFREIYEYYQSHPEEFRRTDSVQWQDIFIDSAKYPDRQAAARVAEDLVNQVRAGDSDSFVRLCEKYDNGPAKTRKGAGMGTHREDIVPPEASAVLFQMRDGDVGPIITVPAGFHVIRLVKRTLPGVAPFDREAQKAIKEKLKNEAYVRDSRLFIEELKRNASIERLPF